MLRFSRLRLTGFKSFVDATELLIEPGLTGVVGPNGCGKSNLVEALKWVMGETSARQMRGTEMDDVIFNGTSSRPSRNLAEVVVTLDNSERTAPAMFNAVGELEVVRRIERERGSVYRVNGREARARDVQLLFADSATGARSTGLVSQGRIGAVIAARPTERRMLLEEAAGIAGLHSRRHEAELRLRGAESNLERLDDVLVTLDTQLLHLRKQARQAARYRNLSDHIRRAEAALFHLRWTAARTELVAERKRHADAERLVIELTSLVAAATSRQASDAAGLPELRQGEASAAAALQRLLLAREGLVQEERRIAETRRDLETRLGHMDADIGREQTLAKDAGDALERLERDRRAITAAREGEDQARANAEAALREVTTLVADLDGRVAAATEAIATDEARRAALERALKELGERKARLSTRLVEAIGQMETLERDSEVAPDLAQAEETLNAAREAVDAAHGAALAAEQARHEADGHAEGLMARRRDAESALARLEAEAKALADVLDTGEGGLFPPLIDALVVEPGLETALGVALGEDLSAPADEPAAVHWRTLPALDPAPLLPEGAEPLARFVAGPRALLRRLSQIGVVPDQDTGSGLRDHLRPGQWLVTREGAFWRWDGFTKAAGVRTAAAIRLEQRNRLAGVRSRLEETRRLRDEAVAAAEAARRRTKEAVQDEQAARAVARQADQALIRARDAHADIRHKMAAQASRLAALRDTVAALRSDVDEAEGRLARAVTDHESLPDTATARERLAVLRAELAERRTLQVERRSALDVLVRSAEGRRRRLGDIERELASWRDRGVAAAGHLEQLTSRRAAAAEELAHLASRPGEIATRRDALAEAIDEAETLRKTAADRLAVAESRVVEADKTLRAGQTQLGRAREEMVRAEGAVEQSRQALQGMRERIAERLECLPDETRAIAGLGPDDPDPDLGPVEQRLERLQKERDTMGPVNLRAEQEVAEQTLQIDTLRSEREDLMKAIEKLRQGISEINREGRQRLLDSFKEVDRHFQELFVRLFGGGTAHLELLESSDPLESGLEIMASPPGKRMQVLSLLSGGEQALTALALLFAVFLVNPAPICVLDEVDAPLDDANVDRFCTMLEEMSASERTRFLVITHHRMTMARMHRLFGVTMAERGVSQLVSVDLRRAEELRESA